MRVGSWLLGSQRVVDGRLRLDYRCGGGYSDAMRGEIWTKYFGVLSGLVQCSIENFAESPFVMRLFLK